MNPPAPAATLPSQTPVHRVAGWWWLAAAAGIVHAAMTCYWAAGGRWLLWSLSSSIVDRFTARMWLLWFAGLAKLVGALAPLVLDSRGWPARRPMRALCWVAAAGLVVWGGSNTLVGNAVLLGAIHPAGGYDRPDMVGHARLWDPLFLLWGLALVVGLLRDRRPRTGVVATSRSRRRR